MRRVWLALGVFGAVLGCCPEPIQETEIDLGVSADLEAVVALGQSREDGWLAVGEHGTIVVWNIEHVTLGERVEITKFDIGDQHLRDVVAEFDAWWIVGDDGFAAVSEDRGKTWTRLDLGVDADLRAIVVLEWYDYSAKQWMEMMMILGEGVVLVQEPDGSWNEMPPPDDSGWGDLNAAYIGFEAFLFGDDGVAWRSDLSGEGDGEGGLDLQWVPVFTGTEEDLVTASGTNWSSYQVRVFAADGTVLTYGDGDGSGERWFDVDVGEQVVDYDRGYILTANGSIHSTDGGGSAPYWFTGSISGARALAMIGKSGSGSVMVVGTSGRAFEVRMQDCDPW